MSTDHYPADQRRADTARPGKDGHPAEGERTGAPGAHPDFDALVRTIWRLRQPDGCPWDRKQTHASIANNMIEEACEVVDAIERFDAAPGGGATPSGGSVPGTGAAPAPDAGGPAGVLARPTALDHLVEELGDVLMQVVLQAQIAADAGEFTIDDVCRALNDKLIRRHPHVFGGHEAAGSAEEVAGIWDQVKMAERASRQDDADGAATATNAPREGLLDGVPTSLPALMACQKISRKAAAAGFEWADEDGVRAQVREEIGEFEDAPKGTPEARMEFGDVLFSLVQIARWEGIDAEGALRDANAKFRRRWAYMERRAWESGRDIADLSNTEQEALWAEAKSKEMHQ